MSAHNGTRHPYSRTLQAVLDALPAQNSPRDRRARRALTAALDALETGATPAQALQAVKVFLEAPRATPAAPMKFLPQTPLDSPELAQNGPRTPQGPR